MGEVWVARNQATGADVAVKLCRGGVATDEATLRFQHEARIGATLSHRSIVRIFDLVEASDGSLLLVMELLRGETLECYLNAHGPLPTKEAVAIALPILSALAHAHDFGVVHRDVTPANIFLAIDPDGRVIPKLVDFGIAKLPASSVRTLDGRALGTPRYMAPEQIRGQGEVDGRSDVFSMAAVIYEMLTSICPFAASTPSASLAAVLEAVVDPDPRIEPRVWIELQRALAKRPYERHEGANELAEALRIASGVTEADLAGLLLRAPPSRENRPGDGAPTQSTRSVGGRSFGYPRALLARPVRLASWVMGALLAASLALGTMVAVRHGRRDAQVATAAPTAVSIRATNQPPAPMATNLLPLPQGPAGAVSSESPAGTIPASAPPQSNRLFRIRRVKPVATTPGF
jgi:serine/threonine protein kinase